MKVKDILDSAGGFEEIKIFSNEGNKTYYMDLKNRYGFIFDTIDFFGEKEVKKWCAYVSEYDYNHHAHLGIEIKVY